MAHNGTADSVTAQTGQAASGGFFQRIVNVGKSLTRGIWQMYSSPARDTQFQRIEPQILGTRAFPHPRDLDRSGHIPDPAPSGHKPQAASHAGFSDDIRDTLIRGIYEFFKEAGFKHEDMAPTSRQISKSRNALMRLSDDLTSGEDIPADRLKHNLEILDKYQLSKTRQREGLGWKDATTGTSFVAGFRRFMHENSDILDDTSLRAVEKLHQFYIATPRLETAPAPQAAQAEQEMPVWRKLQQSVSNFAAYGRLRHYHRRDLLRLAEGVGGFPHADRQEKIDASASRIAGAEISKTAQKQLGFDGVDESRSMIAAFIDYVQNTWPVDDELASKLEAIAEATLTAPETTAPGYAPATPLHDDSADSTFISGVDRSNSHDTNITSDSHDIEALAIRRAESALRLNDFIEDFGVIAGLNDAQIDDLKSLYWQSYDLAQHHDPESDDYIRQFEELEIFRHEILISVGTTEIDTQQLDDLGMGYLEGSSALEKSPAPILTTLQKYVRDRAINDGNLDPDHAPDLYIADIVMDRDNMLQPEDGYLLLLDEVEDFDDNNTATDLSSDNAGTDLAASTGQVAAHAPEPDILRLHQVRLSANYNVSSIYNPAISGPAKPTNSSDTDFSYNIAPSFAGCAVDAFMDRQTAIPTPEEMKGYVDEWVSRETENAQNPTTQSADGADQTHGTPADDDLALFNDDDDFGNAGPPEAQGMGKTLPADDAAQAAAATPEEPEESTPQPPPSDPEALRAAMQELEQLFEGHGQGGGQDSTDPVRDLEGLFGGQGSSPSGHCGPAFSGESQHTSHNPGSGKRGLGRILGRGRGARPVDP